MSSSNLVDYLLSTRTGDSYYYLTALSNDISPLSPSWVILDFLFNFFGESNFLILLKLIIGFTLFLVIKLIDKSLITAIIFSLIVLFRKPGIEFYSTYFSTWRGLIGWLITSYVISNEENRTNFKNINFKNSILLIIASLLHPILFIFNFMVTISYKNESLIGSKINRFLTRPKFSNLKKIKTKLLFIFFIIFLVIGLLFNMDYTQYKIGGYMAGDRNVDLLIVIRSFLYNFFISIIGVKLNIKLSRVIFLVTLISLIGFLFAPAITYKISISIYWLSTIIIINTIIRIINIFLTKVPNAKVFRGTS